MTDSYPIHTATVGTVTARGGSMRLHDLPPKAITAGDALCLRPVLNLITSLTR